MRPPERRAAAGEGGAGGDGSAPDPSYWPMRISVLVAIALYVFLPDALTPGPHYAVAALEALMLLILIVATPHRASKQARWHRRAVFTMVGLVTVANLANIGLL